MLLLIPIVLMTTGCDWLQYRFGANQTGFNAGESSLTALHDQQFPTWTAAVSGGTPVVANGVVYVSTQGGDLFAFPAMGTSDCTGDNVGTPCEPLWTAKAGQESFSSPVVADGRVYLGSEDGNLYVFDAAGVENCGGTPKTCTPLWKDQVSSEPASLSIPTVANGRVYVGILNALTVFSADGTDNCSGTPKTCLPLWIGNIGLGGGFQGAPAVDGGRVFVGSSDHNLYAFDAAGVTNCRFGDCDPEWIGPTGGPINSTPAATGGRVFVASYDANLYAFAEDGGSNCSGKNVCLPLWRAGFAAPLEWSPAVAYGHVYQIGQVSGVGNVLNVYDAAGIANCTGTPARCSPLWNTTDAEPESSPVVAGGLVFVGTDVRGEETAVSAFDAIGTSCTNPPPPSAPCPPRWQGITRFDVSTSPAVANGWLYASDGGNLYAFVLT